MSKRKDSSRDTRVNIEGGVGQNAQIAVGDHNVQTSYVGANDGGVTQAQLDELKRELEKLIEKVKVEAPPQKQDEAKGQIKELEEAITSKPPDIDRMSGVKSWFKRNIPSLLGSVGTLVGGPIVGKVVEAAGEGLAGEIRRRFRKEE